ncbi:hypothetical protein L917_10636 [Phytophthora nicotianae]|uniref:ZSWIM1/3 RNaseH-like domain-containing protein n=1 Tax=Phytophthora nicotianae TaxID=4792 RepID=W2L012_PHYNI|nr:hypothetical protein L917_10636 [Phytophthora nicotianae]
MHDTVFEGIPNAQNTDDVLGDSVQAGDANINDEWLNKIGGDASSVHCSGDDKFSDVASSGSRKRDHDECDDELYYVPPLRSYYKEWKHLEKCLKEYQQDNHSVLVIAETQNVRPRNKQIAKMKIHSGKQQSELPLVPEELDPYQRVYICTHGWKERVRSKGHRPRQTLKGVGCPMRFQAQFVQRTNGKWRIEIKQAFYGHNYSLTEQAYRVYPSVRRVPSDSPIMSDVELMMASGSKVSKIYDYIRERTPHYVQLKDYIVNVYSLRFRVGGRLSDKDLVAELLVCFELESAGNVAAVDEDTAGNTAVVTISSQHTRKLYKRFPEILIVDCTHKTNRYNYQLCTLMVMDQFGHAQAVQHFVLERNADWHMDKAVEQFQLANDWERTKVIMVDKDLTEIGGEPMRDDKKYDTYPSGILKQMDHCVSNMVYTKSEDEFDQHATEFKHLACRENRDSLWNYFDKNWVACKDMWVTVYRMNLPHFRNNANNRLESFFGKLKADLDSSMSMRECLEATIRDQRPKEDEYVTRVVMPGTRRDLTYDDEMNQLFDMTSEWLADVFEPEYKFAVNPESAKMYNIDDEDLYVNFVWDGQVSRRQIQLDVYL